MSKSLGSTPADRELAAIGVGAGALLLGVTAPSLALLASGIQPRSTFPAPWWLAIVLALVAVAVVFQVQGWALRLGLSAFAALQVNAFVQLGARLTTALEVVCAASVVVAAWPHSGKRARITATVLFVAGVGFRAWVLAR